MIMLMIQKNKIVNIPDNEVSMYEQNGWKRFEPRAKSAIADEELKKREAEQSVSIPGKSTAKSRS